MSEAFHMVQLRLEEVQNKTKAQNKGEFKKIIEQLKRSHQSIIRIAYLETTSPEHMFASSSVAILDNHNRILFWFGLSAEGIWINQYQHPEKMGCFHYHKIYSVESEILVKQLDRISNENFNFGFILGDNCKVFALNFLKACKLVNEVKHLTNSGRCRPGTAQTLAKLDKGLMLHLAPKELISLAVVNNKNFNVMLEKYIAYREKKPNRLSLFGGYARSEKIDVATKLLKLDHSNIELTAHDYRVMTQGRLGLFMKYCEESRLIHIKRVESGGVKYQVSYADHALGLSMH